MPKVWFADLPLGRHAIVIVNGRRYCAWRVKSGDLGQWLLETADDA